jgi:hypothetical protein
VVVPYFGLGIHPRVVEPWRAPRARHSPVRGVGPSQYPGCDY